MNRDNTKYSSYWLRDGLFDDDDSLDLNPIESKHSNLMSNASIRNQSVTSLILLPVNTFQSPLV